MAEAHDEWKERWDNLRHLKLLLTQRDERALLAPWAFWVWGAIVFTGTGVAWFERHAWPWTFSGWLTRFWLPLFLLAILSETVAFVSQILKDQQPWRSKPFLRELGGLAGYWTAGTLIFVILIKPENPVPALLLLFLSTGFFWLGLLSFTSMYWEALGLLAAGSLFLAFGWTSDAAYLAAGLLCGAVFWAAGIQAVLKGRRR